MTFTGLSTFRFIPMFSHLRILTLKAVTRCKMEAQLGVRRRGNGSSKGSEEREREG